MYSAPFTVERGRVNEKGMEEGGKVSKCNNVDYFVYPHLIFLFPLLSL